MAALRITLLKSVNSVKPALAETVRSLGLKRIRHTVEVPDNPAIRGMAAKVRHLIKVEEIETMKAKDTAGKKRRSHSHETQ